ncbi:MAG: hypothetical protein JWP74_1227 [Marmoricola sp.]|nr:hypothetical protein [Marmoricola sp.]
MTGTDESADGAIEREETEDHDLLTYGEAGVRLQDAVRGQRALVSELESVNGPGLDEASARLSALEAALERNRRQPINDDNFEKFFGFSGIAKRNT